jgi:hypothetical protein
MPTHCLSHTHPYTMPTHYLPHTTIHKQVVGPLLTGISTAWWKRSHNAHHVVTNSVSHDPDTQHIPFFAITPDLFKKGGVWSYYHRRVCLNYLAPCGLNPACLNSCRPFFLNPACLTLNHKPLNAETQTTPNP